MSVSAFSKSIAQDQVYDDFYVFSSATDHFDESYTNSSLIALRLILLNIAKSISFIVCCLVVPTLDLTKDRYYDELILIYALK